MFHYIPKRQAGTAACFPVLVCVYACARVGGGGRVCDHARLQGRPLFSGNLFPVPQPVSVYLFLAAVLALLIVVSV